MTRFTSEERKIMTGLIAGILALIILLLSGCSDKATRKLRRSEKLRIEAIALGAKVDQDTLWKTLEIPIPVVRTDTIFKPITGDTVTITKDRLKIQYVKLPADSVWIYGESKADTVYKDVFHTVTQNVTVPVKDNKWKWIAIAFGGLLLLVIFLVRLAPITR